MSGETRASTQYDIETSTILMRRVHPWIAAYTDVVTFLLRCNMDIKFVGSGDAAKAFLYYVTDYITKPSLPVHAGVAALMYAMQKISDKESAGCAVSPLSAITNAVNSMMGRQEISHPQVMSYLLGGGDHYTSESFVILHWGLILRYVRDVIDALDTAPENGVETSDPVNFNLNTETPTFYNQRMDYIFRSENLLFESLNLYDFVSITAKTLHKSGKIDITDREGCFAGDIHPQRNSHYLVLRRSPKIPVIMGPAFTNPSKSAENKEKWSFEMLVLLKPWRDPRRLKGEHDSWTEACEEFLKTADKEHLRIVENVNVFEECKEARDSNKLETCFDDGGDAALVMEEDLYPKNVDEGEFNIIETGEELIEASGTIDNVAAILGSDVSKMLDLCLNIDNFDDEERPSVNDGKRATLMSTIDEQLLRGYSNDMASRKRKRYEEYDEVVPETLSKRPRLNTHVATPTVAVGTLSSQRPYTIEHLRTQVMNRVVEDMNLADNKEQLRAFETVARHACTGSRDQLLMHVSGVGGTGKSHVIKALIRFFEDTGNRHQIRVGAPTGIAATLIEGKTLHSLIMSNPKGKGVNSKRLIAMWAGVRYLIVDEISMVGATFLSTFSARLREARGDDANSTSKPFGDISVIFFGDMAQLKPPAQSCLYDHKVLSNPSFRMGKDSEGISSMNGVFLWRQVKTVIQLRKNHRHAYDPSYANFLDHLRVGKCAGKTTATGITFLDLIRSRTLSEMSYNMSTLKNFADAPVIVGTKDIRDAINERMIKYHSVRLRREVNPYYSKDSISSTKATLRQAKILWPLNSTITKDALGVLQIFIGMKMMVTENVSVELGIVNGCEGIVDDLKYTEEGGYRYLTVVYLRIEGLRFGFKDLDEDVVPILPVGSYITHNGLSTTNVGNSSFRRTQVPLVPSYSYTDFKSQGRTLVKAIVDLASARGQGPYVMLSRVKTLQGIAVLRWFPPNKINGELSHELRDELKRLSDLSSEE